MVTTSPGSSGKVVLACLSVPAGTSMVNLLVALVIAILEPAAETSSALTLTPKQVITSASANRGQNSLFNLIIITMPTASLSAQIGMKESRQTVAFLVKLDLRRKHTTTHGRRSRRLLPELKTV